MKYKLVKNKSYYLQDLEPFNKIGFRDWYDDYPDYNSADNSCSIRALVTLTGHTWEEIYAQMFELSLLRKTTFNNRRLVLDDIYDELGYKYDRTVTGTVGSFIINNMKGSFSIMIDDHIFTVKDGVIYDTFRDERDKDRLLSERILGVYRKYNYRLKGYKKM